MKNKFLAYEMFTHFCIKFFKLRFGLIYLDALFNKNNLKFKYWKVIKMN